MEIDKRTIKTLASNTKVAILKSLIVRKKMPAELSTELSLSRSTVSEHLKELETLGMVRRLETGHKWVYYELTGKSTDIIKPRAPVQSIFLLVIGILAIMISIGGMSFFVGSSSQSFASDVSSEKMLAGAPSTPLTGTPPVQAISITEIILPTMLLLGIVFVVVGLWRIKSRRFIEKSSI